MNTQLDDGSKKASNTNVNSDLPQQNQLYLLRTSDCFVRLTSGSQPYPYPSEYLEDILQREAIWKNTALPSHLPKRKIKGQADSNGISIHEKNSPNRSLN